ncbi:hypothetical protein EVAR_18044_1 [Eumeta japonica]|uniref:Uncharacterized protein n=1 Tax=Eumeta variegata TaxID=151549 RepID=A0A4C1XV64_EUMVA|nr:hypothetical protein EVAR_18044_1 [Eumeta japonica]
MFGHLGGRRRPPEPIFGAAILFVDILLHRRRSMYAVDVSIGLVNYYECVCALPLYIMYFGRRLRRRNSSAFAAFIAYLYYSRGQTAARQKKYIINHTYRHVTFFLRNEYKALRLKYTICIQFRERFYPLLKRTRTFHANGLLVWFCEPLIEVLRSFLDPRVHAHARFNISTEHYHKSVENVSGSTSKFLRRPTAVEETCVVAPRDVAAFEISNNLVIKSSLNDICSSERFPSRNLTSHRYAEKEHQVAKNFKDFEKRCCCERAAHTLSLCKRPPEKISLFDTRLPEKVFQKGKFQYTCRRDKTPADWRTENFTDSLLCTNAEAKLHSRERCT